MKKLRNKVFLVIFSLLTIFTLVLFITLMVRTYVERRNSVSNTLVTIYRTFNILDIRKESDSLQLPKGENEYKSDYRKIYLDSIIYTVFFNDNGKYQGVISNARNGEINEEYIKVVASNIINNHIENFYIGNLYTDKYAYVFIGNNILVIMDNTELNKNIISHTLLSIVLFILCELLIVIFTYLITEWIITPVKKSFEKQKIFVADASHELKTPLSVMIASADAYFNDKDDKWIYNMRNESERMINLVTELLDLAKTEQEQDIDMEVKNISDIIEGSILTFESLFYENHIKLKYDIEPNINMNCNENMIVDLMSILIDNAIKHCSKKGKVIVNLSKSNKQIILEVINTGLPIKKEDEEKIFERFYKVDSSRNRNNNNYGLGLAIAKNIVERHNGKINAQSADGYTTFKIKWNQK